MAISKFSQNMRVVHRYLGFFLAGIMAVYSLSGVVLVFRDTDLLKKQVEVSKTLESNLSLKEVGSFLKVKNIKITKEEGDIVFFNSGQYNRLSGEASVMKKQLPYILGKMTHLHKAKSSEPLYFLNIFFGLSLLFFVVSSFWMFMPSSSVFKKGMYFTVGGIALTLILLLI